MDEMLSGRIECSESVSVRDVLGNVGVRTSGPWAKFRMMIEFTLPADMPIGRLNAAINGMAASIGANIEIAIVIPESEFSHEVH